jgi:Flp pilus assembly protein TadG
MGLKMTRRPRERRCALSCRRCAGAVATEFALMAPAIISIAAGIVDFGMLATKSAALAGTTRVGAEYARLHPVDRTGTQNLMQRSMVFMPALAFPANFPQSCGCDDGIAIACSASCAAAGRPGPNRVFISVSASQGFTPLVPWPGIPASLSATTEVRMQ